jgi:hypothetical protein
MKIKRDSALNLRVPLDIKLQLAEIAGVEDISSTSLVIRFIREGLTRMAPAPAPAPITNEQVHKVVTKAIKAKAKTAKAKRK